jgi:hypothetical protein
MKPLTYDRHGQLYKLWELHCRMLLGKTHALIKYSVFALFDGFLFLFIQEQQVGFI